MPAFQFPKSIESRPVYAALAAGPGTAHLMLASGEGVKALCDLAEAAPDLMAGAHVIYVAGDHAAGRERVEALAPAQLYVAPTYLAAVPVLRKALTDAHMGLRIYIAGTEGFIGQAMQEAVIAGFPMEAIQREHRGSTARRMQCVHCKGITEDVATDPFVCAHCGLHLYVRDHYSHRLAAFQGVRVDAEDPGLIPPVKAIYP